MKKIYNRNIRRYAIAAVLLLLAGYISVFIKDSIDSRNPEVSLPIINVTTGYTYIPNVPRAGYEWSFRTKDVMSPYLSSIDVPLIAYDALPDVPIQIGFTTPYTQLVLYEGRGVMNDGSVVTSEIFTEKRSNFTTPKEEGIYVYKVVATFNQGTIVHYFALDVKVPHLMEEFL